MKKLGRILLWFVGGLFLLACLLLLAVNLYVQSQGVHHRIQQELSQRLGTPLRLRQISVTPWGGLKLNGITIPQTGNGLRGDFLEAETFQLRVQFLSIFSDQLVIRQVSLIEPRVVWAQNNAGKWRLPPLPSAPAAPRLAQNAPASPPPVSAASPNESPNEPPNLRPNESAAPVAEATPFTPEVRRVSLRDGDFTFLDSAGHRIAQFSGIDFTSSLRTASAVKGSVKIAKVSLRDRFFLNDLDSPLHYDPGELDFSSITANTAGGRLQGAFEMHLLETDTPFHVTLKFRDLAAAQLIANAGGPIEIVQGRLEGSLVADGRTADSNFLNGHGEIFLRGGKVQQYSLLVALGQILQIDELTQLQLEQAEVHFRLSPGVVTVDRLILRSPNIRLTAKGTIGFNGKMHLNSQLAINEKIRRQLFRPLQDNFQLIAGQPGYAAVAFTISGTVERPRTNLMEKLVGRDLHDLGSVISSFFGHPKKKKPHPPAAPGTVGQPAAPAVAASLAPNEPVAPNESASPNSISPASSASTAVASTPAPSPNESAPVVALTPAPTP